jgi:hypothetical protein
MDMINVRPFSSSSDRGFFARVGLWRCLSLNKVNWRHAKQCDGDDADDRFHDDVFPSVERDLWCRKRSVLWKACAALFSLGMLAAAPGVNAYFSSQTPLGSRKRRERIISRLNIR